MTNTTKRTDRKPDPVAELVEFKPYRKGYAVRFDFDPFLVALIKKLPATDRSYVAEGRYWVLTTPRAEFVAMVAKTCGYHVEGIEEDRDQHH